MVNNKRASTHILNGWVYYLKSNGKQFLHAKCPCVCPEGTENMAQSKEQTIETRRQQAELPKERNDTGFSAKNKRRKTALGGVY